METFIAFTGIWCIRASCFHNILDQKQAHSACYHSWEVTIYEGSAAFKDFVKASSSFNPSSGDFASPRSFTIALPTITPSAPHPATYSSTYDIVNLSVVKNFLKNRKSKELDMNQVSSLK